jgi:hypothetical protein
MPPMKTNIAEQCQAAVAAAEAKATEIRNAIAAKVIAAGYEVEVTGGNRLRSTAALPEDARIRGDDTYVHEWLTVKVDQDGGIYPKVRGITISHDFGRKRYTSTVKLENVDADKLATQLIDATKAKLDSEVRNNRETIEVRKNNAIAEVEFPTGAEIGWESKFGNYARGVDFMRRRNSDGTYEVSLDGNGLTIDEAITLLQALKGKTDRKVDFNIRDMTLDLQTGKGILEVVKAQFPTT